MNETIRVNLHCHSHFSDGELPPGELAERLAASGVRAASLTDHDTIEGTAAFREALSRKGIGVISGIELTVASPQGKELHLLGYGFDAGNKAFQGILQRTHSPRNQKYRHPLAGPLQGSEPPSERLEREGPTIPRALVPSLEAIRAVHDAGGLVFLAHPVLPGEPFDPETLESLIRRFKAEGLDGIEAFYPGCPPGLSGELVALAEKFGLLVSAGSDFHGIARLGLQEAWIDFPEVHWLAFRDALLRKSAAASSRSGAAKPHSRRRLPRFRRRDFLIRIVLPTILAIGLFIVFLFFILIPSFEGRLLERKRDMIRELTNVAFSVLAEYDGDVREGRLSREQAQRAAAERIRDLRYGNEGKDYFWIQDTQPRMIMHPYRTDLDGQKLTDFKDPRGVRIFVEFVNTLKAKEDAYVEYVWQWKDDPERLVPKQSYIKKFEPWGWIVGTGLYVEDVRREIAALTAHLVTVSVIITVICALLLGFVAIQSMRIELKRRKAEDELHESHEKYRTLVESATEGTLMILDGRPSFANPTMLDMLEYSEAELPLLDLSDLFPEDVALGEDGLPAVFARSGGNRPPVPAETGLRTRGGTRLDVALTVTRISFAGREGFVLSARDISGSRARGEAPGRRDIERENLIGELQASLMFLHEPIARSAGTPVFCDIKETVSRAASLMTERNANAVIVTAEGKPVGILTDHDIRARVVTRNLPYSLPVFEFMSSPLVTIGERALVYEAILMMRENKVDHLPVRDDGNRIVGILRNRELMLFHRYSLAVLTQEIRNARSIEDIAGARGRLPQLVQALVKGGAKARNITRAVTAVSDSVAEKLIELAIREFGPPPARFAFLALGSQGREEQTLVTDQDHAVIFEDVAEAGFQTIQEYFLKMGGFVSAGMEKAGLPLCRGKIMADNPQWCQPISVWKGYFSEWLRTAEPQDILDLNIFFDFRTIVGDSEFALGLRRHIDGVLEQEPPFLLHYAQHTLQYKTPVTLFGNIQLESTREGSRTLNLKDAVMPVVNFARLYAFRHGVQETNTLDRLHALRDIGVLKGGLHDEAVQVYDYLTQLRLAHQVRISDQGAAPDNDIESAELTHLEETLLKQAFSQISNIQKKVSFDFLGSA